MKRCLLIIVLGVISLSALLAQSATISAPTPLNEAELDFQTITISLTDETWSDGNLDRRNFRLVNAPDGLSVYAVVLTSMTQAILDLAFNGTDFDSDITNFSLTIDNSELTQTSSGVLPTNSLTIDAYDERVTITPDMPLSEQTLDDRYLDITLSEEEFTSMGSVSSNMFDLNNEPVGLVIESVTVTDATHAVMQLAFPPGNDFDTPITNFRVDVSGDILRYTPSASEIRSNNLTIAALDETPQATLTADSTVLEERWLDVRSLTITLTEESFRNYNNLDDGDFELRNEPSGLRIQSVYGISPGSMVIELRFDQRDFDEDYTNFRVLIKDDALVNSEDDLRTNRLTIVANIESAYLEPDQPLREDILDGRALTVHLVNEVFEDPPALRRRHFRLINEPSGLSIRNLSFREATSVQLNLQFDGNDFDSDIDDFMVRIERERLVYTTEDDLYTGPITIQAIGDGPVASLRADSTLTEERLDARVLTVDLIQEEFEESGILQPSHFNLVNGPAGLTMESVTRISAVSARILLDFDDTDFDDNISDFHVVIEHAGLVRSNQDLVTNSLNIRASLEPDITSVEIPNDTMRIGDQVTVTIHVDNDRGNAYTLNGGTIGGYPLTGLSRINETTYLSGFTVTEGGNDYAAHANIPVSGLQLNNGPVLGRVYQSPIVQDNDLLDANRPVIHSVSALSEGPQNIGSEILFEINSDQPGYTFTAASHVNNVPVSGSSILVTSLGAGDYELSYTVGEGDDDVTEGNLELELTARDVAGNLGVPYRDLSANDLSIDASRPMITRAYIHSTDTILQVGETLEILVQADQSGFSAGEDTRVNDVAPGPTLVFNDLGNGLYSFRYTVSETDGTVSNGNLAVSIVLVDQPPYLNPSLPFTDLDANNITILTERPSANVSGSADICHGESSTVTITLGGMPPWEFDIYDGNSTFTISNITDPVYQFTAQPELTTNYTVPRLIDGTGRTAAGFGNAQITVHPLPDVEILNLLEIYDIEESPVILDFTPEGGNFTGGGITHPPWTFIPALAGTQDSPHEIVYSYTDENTCSSSDTVIVQVVEAGGYISFERSAACFNDAEFYITGHNEGNTIGTLAIQPTPPAGAFENLDSNRAVFRPAMYGLNEDLTVQVSYTFTDTLGEEHTLLRLLTVEYLEDIRIDAIPDVYFCRNDAPIALSGIPETGVFSGPGVEWNALLGYQFDPFLAGLDTNKIYYTYTSGNHCSVSDSAILIVRDAPIADFTTVESCIAGDGGLVQFVNRSDTGLSLDEVWSWEFGDIFSGEDNYSPLMNPSHYYDKPGTWTIRLDVSSDNGCSDFMQKTMALNLKPSAEFTWNSHCLTDDPIVFEGQETVDYPDHIASRMWYIYRGNTEVFRSDTNQPSYHFESEGSFRVSYSIVTNNGCTDTTDKTITLSPTYLLAQDPYFEDFEIAQVQGWSSMGSGTSRNSWVYGTVNPLGFPETAASGSMAWYTDLAEPREVEKSWVQSPCFNFQSFYRPMVSLDIKRSLSRNQDGVALQYTYDNGNTWTNVGGVEDGGLNWYNSDLILNGDGGQHTGWTAESESSSDDRWYNAAHEVDILTGLKEVQFRILFNSMGGDPFAEGFAFDNFTIKQRTRLTVLEYFTNAHTSGCYGSDSLVRSLVKEVPADVVDIQYHAAGSVPDQLYLDNPIPPNNRGTVYGVSSLPMAVLDGGYQEWPGYPGIYDFNLRPPRAADIKLRALSEPDFRITIVAEYVPYLAISADIEALNDVAAADRVLYAIVMEKQITGPEYTGTNGSTRFENVARIMIPGAEGTLFNQGWTEGQVESIYLTCEDSFFPMVEDSLAIVVYLQDEVTGEVLQAATIPEFSSVSAPDLQQEPTGILVYPNPAGEHVHVYFEDPPLEPLQLALYDLSGKMVLLERIAPLQQRFTLPLGDLEKGLYIMQIRTGTKMQPIHRDRLFHY